MNIVRTAVEAEFSITPETAERPFLLREFSAEIVRGDGRTVDVRIVPYGEVIEHNDGFGGVERGVVYREEFVPGVFNHQLRAANRIYANFEHQKGLGNHVGKGIALRESPDGFHGTFRIKEGQDGDTILDLINDGSLDGISVEATPVSSRRSDAGVVQRVKANLINIAFTRFAAYRGAKVLAVREETVEAKPILDAGLMPVDIDPERVERLRALGAVLPDRYLKAHPDETDTPADDADTSEDGTRQAEEATTSEE